MFGRRKVRNDPELCRQIEEVIGGPEGARKGDVGQRPRRRVAPGDRSAPAAEAGMAMSLNRLSDVLYRAARLTRDARAVKRSVETGSMKPLEQRLLRKVLGRGFGWAMRKGGL
jgi:hypothetical protein